MMMNLSHPKCRSVFFPSKFGVTETIFTPLPEKTKKPDKIYESMVFRDLGSQARRDSDPWEEGNKGGEPYCCLREWARTLWDSGEGAGGAQALPSWGTEQGLQWASRGECQWGKSCSRSTPLEIWGGPLTSSWCRQTTQGWGKNHQKRSARTGPRVHTHLEIIPVATAEEKTS